MRRLSVLFLILVGIAAVAVAAVPQHEEEYSAREWDEVRDSTSRE
jgi:hypothetical protein